jgi:hypothetical protein
MILGGSFGIWLWCWPTAAIACRTSARFAIRKGCSAVSRRMRPRGDERHLEAVRRARRAARTRAWAAGARPAEIVLDIDSALVGAHSEKQGAAATYKRGFGFHPILCYLGAEALAGILRPGVAGANTADDHIGVLVEALDQLPAGVHEDPEVPAQQRLARTSHRERDFPGLLHDPG